MKRTETIGGADRQPVGIERILMAKKMGPELVLVVDPHCYMARDPVIQSSAGHIDRSRVVRIGRAIGTAYVCGEVHAAETSQKLAVRLEPHPPPHGVDGPAFSRVVAHTEQILAGIGCRWSAVWENVIGGQLDGSVQPQFPCLYLDAEPVQVMGQIVEIPVRPHCAAHHSPAVSESVVPPVQIEIGSSGAHDQRQTSLLT